GVGRSPRRRSARGARASRGFDEDWRFHVLAHPELEHQQAPEPVPMIRASGLVLVEQPPDGIGTEPAAVTREEIVSRLAQLGPEPAAEWDAEAALPPTGDLGRKVCGKRTP